jgi:hypothetical protein
MDGRSVKYDYVEGIELGIHWYAFVNIGLKEI